MSRDKRQQGSSSQPDTAAPRAAVPWTLKDVIGVYLCVVVGVIGGLIAGHSVTQQAWVAVTLARYTGGLIALWVPIRFIRIRYGLSKGALGLKCGKLHLRTSVALGIGLAVAYFLIVRIYLFQNPIAFGSHLLTWVLLPLFPYGFASTVLVPLSEEVLHRGFLYAYLRTVLGKWPALVLQAVMFTALHLRLADPSWSYGIHLADVFLLGLAFGFLYEHTESLYPSIVCHGTINYLAIL